MSAIFKRTKILATVGPACDSPEQLEAMVEESGVSAQPTQFAYEC